MALLGAVQYDPAVAVSKSSSLTAMVAFDTTNARITFTAPANGSVFVRLMVTTHGAITATSLLLGVLEGATVRARQAPIGRMYLTSASQKIANESSFVITGLTPGNSYTFDAAYGVETSVAASTLKYGGPDDTTTDNAHGALIFEVWETPTLLAADLYDPAGAVSKVTTSLLAMTAFDTTNLRHVITAPASGKVYWRIRTLHHGSTTPAMILLGVLDGATVRARVAPILSVPSTNMASSLNVYEASGVMTGLTPGNSYTLDAAFSVDVVGAASSALKYGGPDNATANDAFGGIAYELWTA